MPVEQTTDTIDNPNSIHFLCFKILHDLKEFSMNMWLVTKFNLNSVNIEQGIVHP